MLGKAPELGFVSLIFMAEENYRNSLQARQDNELIWADLNRLYILSHLVLKEFKDVSAEH